MYSPHGVFVLLLVCHLDSPLHLKLEETCFKQALSNIKVSPFPFFQYSECLLNISSLIYE